MKIIMPLSELQEEYQARAVKVVCGIIRNGEKIFIARRKQEKSFGGLWEFPGGKVEEGEELTEALIRELKEELGMEVRIHRFFGKTVHHDDAISIELIAFECEFISASFSLTDHDEHAFVSISELAAVHLAPADIPFMEELTRALPHYK